MTNSVVIGRFEPFHNGHKHLVETALKVGEKVCVVLGSARTAPSIKNPFTPSQRVDMIRSCFSDEDNERLCFVSVKDTVYNDTIWFNDVRNKVLRELGPNCEINLVGNIKDDSSYYLKRFPTWKLVEAGFGSQKMDATTVRERIFNRDSSWMDMVPDGARHIIQKILDSGSIDHLFDEYNFNLKYKAEHQFVKFKDDPNPEYEPVFLTVDNVVFAAGHVLLIKRGECPGKGLWALPGGFLQPGKTLKETALNELKEETRIRVPNEVLLAGIVEDKPFDAPSRSTRGRTVTHAYHYRLDEYLDDGLPSVVGADDAESAHWVPLTDLDIIENEFYEDHIHIIRYFMNRR